jgi:IS6 family transposase
MTTDSLFKWQHFLPKIILLNMRWYCRYSSSYRDLEEMMAERGVAVHHSTLNRWVLKFTPEIDKRIRPFLTSTNDSSRVDETYIKVKGEWKYLYRAVDELKQDKTLKAQTKLRQRKYLNNIIEQDHRNVKRIVKPMMGFQSFNPVRRTLRGIEAMNMALVF